MKKSTIKFCVMLLAFCISAIHLQAMDEWDGKTIAKGFYSGTGTKANPYKIFTASQFLYFIQQTKDGNTFEGQYIELCNDIAFKDAEKLVEGRDFYGDFDGNDHIIQVNKYWEEYHDYILGGWTLFNLYGSMHDVKFIRANEVVRIYTGGILYNCMFEFSGYHGSGTVYLDGGTIANCVSNAASYQQRLEGNYAEGFIALYNSNWGTPYGYCLNCYFPIVSRHYYGCHGPHNGSNIAPNYYGTIESCGEEAGNDWVLNHTEYDYKTWPLTFSPTYPEYQIKEQPQTYNPSVVYPYSDEALYQWYYQERKPITLEDITADNTAQTKTIIVSVDNAVLSFDFKAHGYTYTGYNDGTDKPAWININGEEIVYVYKEVEGAYSCQLSAGTHEINFRRSDISNIRITYPTDTLENETSSVLSKQTIMERPGAYFCQVSYGAGYDVMYSDYVDYEKLLTIDNVTYVVNEDSTATVLWIADMAENIAIPETVNYNDVNYPVTSISSKAFVDCTSLASIKCKALNAPALLGGTTFEGLNGVSTTSNATLCVPNDCVPIYSEADGWKDFSKIVEPNIDLVDGQTFSNAENEVMGIITYSRTLPNTEWNALYLPFKVPVEMLTDNYDVAYFNNMHAYDRDNNGQIDEMDMEIMLLTEGTLHANHPYFIRAKNDAAKELNIELTDATLYTTQENSLTCSSVYLNYELKGIYTQRTAAELTDCYAINTSGAWSPIATGSYLNPFRLYLKITSRDGSPVEVAPSALQSIRIRLKGDYTTDIDEVETQTTDATIIYDLSGRRVENPGKGIYIVNGKKVVLK